MEDFFYLALGFAVCCSPFAFIALFIRMLSGSRDAEARARIDALEAQVASLESKANWLRTEGGKLAARIAQLEAGATTRAIDVAVVSARALDAAARATVPDAASSATDVALPERVEGAPLEGSASVPLEGSASVPLEGSASVPLEGTALEGTASAPLEGTASVSLEGTASGTTEATPALTAAPEGVATASEGSASTTESPASTSDGSASTSSTSTSSTGMTTTPAPSASPPSSVTPPASSADASGSEVGWEQWVGVRGAAALGSIVFVIAALYFLKYSVDHGWIGPFARVLTGLSVGLGAVVGSELVLRRRDQPALANWLAGAGVAILYASSWAASGLYDLVPSLVSGIAMVAITGAAVTLAAFRDSMPIAILGLIGGFLTPLALSSGQDRPIPLFAYLLVLDGALLYLAQRKRWPALALTALGFTALYEVFWVFGRMGETTFALGLVIVLVFAALFVVVPLVFTARDASEEEDLTQRLVRIGGVVLPFALGLAFAGRTSALAFGPTLALVVALALGCVALAVRDRVGVLVPGAAAGVVALGLVYATSHHADANLPLHLLALLGAPLLVFHATALVRLRGDAWGLAWAEPIVGAEAASAIASLGAAVTLALFAIGHADAFWWELFALSVFGAFTLHLAVEADWPLLAATTSGFHGVVWLVWLGVLGHGSPRLAATITVVALLYAAVHHAIATWRASREDAATWTAPLEIGALVNGGLVALAVWSESSIRTQHAWLYVVVALVVPLFFLLAAARGARVAPLFGAASLGASLLAAGMISTIWMPGVPSAPLEDVAWLRFGSAALGVVFFTLAPTVIPSLSRERWAWRSAAITPMAFFPVLHASWTHELGARFVGALPVLLALLTLALVLRARRAAPGVAGEAGSVQTSALVWLAGATMLFVTIAIPLQLDREWITIGWALEAAALLALHRRLDHAGLKWVASTLFAIVCVRLLLNPYVLGYYERSSVRVFNWLSYTYLVPAATLVLGAWLLHDLELERRRAWERSFLPESVAAPLASLFYAAALVVGFAWLNLTIVDWFATGPALTIPTERLAARDLTMSIAWAVYGLFLLALGMWRKNMPMRVASLGVVLLTLAKVGLYDIVVLRDLYLVAALVGLAFALLVVSFAYQRFVFRTVAQERS